MRKRILSILLCLVMVVGLFPTMAFAAGSSGAKTGSGTASDPYIVTTFEELKAELEKDTVGLGMQYIKVPNGINIEKLLKLESYNSAFNVIRQKTLIVDGTVTVIAAAGTAAVRSMFSVHGPGNRLDIRGSGSLTFKANTNASCNAVVDVNDEGMLNVSGGVTLSGTFNTAVYGMAVYNYGGTVNIDNATLTGETAGVSYGAAVHANGGTTNIKNATLKSSVSPGANAIRRKGSGTIFVGKDASLTIENSIIHTTDGVTDGHSIYLERGNTKHISNYLGTNQKIYRQSDKVQLSADVTSLTDSVYITDDVSEKINAVSLTVGPLITREMISDLACSYSPSIKMTLTNFNVYKGLNNTTDKIEGENTPYAPDQSYTVMYVFRANEGFKFSTEATKNVTVTGGDFWMADTYGGTTNAIRVFVNIPASTIDKVSLNIKSLNERKTLSDLACSYSPAGGMTLTNFNVYKGLNNTSDKIEGENTPYDPNQSYTVMYVFRANEGFKFSTEATKNVTVTGGNFWMADTYGGTTNVIRVFVTFPGATPIESVTLNVPELKVGDTSGDFTLSGTNTGVSTVTTEWKDIPPTGAVESTFYSARITLTAEDGYVFDANTNVTLIGDNWGSATGISSDGKTMTVLVSVRILHKHTFGEWKIASTGDVHFRECSCGAQEKEPHTWEYNDATGKYKCAKCNYEIAGGEDSITSVLAYPRSPIAGEHPGDYTAAEWVKIIGANYKVESIDWKNMNDTDVTTFEAGKIYKGTVTFKADTGFAFDGSRIYSNKIFDSSNAEVVGKYTLADRGTTLTATFKLKDENVVKPGLNVKVKLPTLNDKIGKSLPEVELVDTTLPEKVALVYSVHKDNLLGEEITDPNYKVESNQKYFYVVWLKVGNSTDITEITKTYNVSYEVKDGGDAETHANLAEYGVLAMYQTPDTSKINSVALTVTAPKYGDAPATTATGANDTLYTVGTPTWSPAVTDGKFGADTYTVSIPVTAKSGYSFDANCLYTVNGYVATYADGKVSYTFPALTAPHEHNFGGAWTWWNDSEHYQSCTCGEMKFEAHDFTAWTPNTDNSTHSRTCNKCKKSGEATNYTETANHSWVFDHEDAPTFKSAGTRYYKCSAGCTATKTESIPQLKAITAVNVTVTAPVKGATPGTATPADTTYSVADTAWDPTVSSTFAGGTKYTVKVSLEANGNYRFTDKTTFQINGQTAKLDGAIPATGLDNTIITLTFPATEGGSTGGGGGGGVTTYPITVKSAKNGDVTASHKSASKGTAVTLTVDPDKGYVLDTLTVLDGKDKEIKLTEKNGKYTFTMPASKVTVAATFKASAPTGKNPFIDVPAGSYYEDAVVWAVEKGITSGTSTVTFDPNGNCTRAQAVTFLWRAAGSPAPKTKVMPFTDVPSGSYYYDAVLWAVEQGITKGTSDTAFSPNTSCTRAQIVTFLWRANGSPAVSGNSAFTDVASDAYYAAAVTWAEKNDVTGGIGGGLFGSNNNCTRAQIVTFIYRSVK